MEAIEPEGGGDSCDALSSAAPFRFGSAPLTTDKKCVTPKPAFSSAAVRPRRAQRIVSIRSPCSVPLIVPTSAVFNEMTSSPEEDTAAPQASDGAPATKKRKCIILLEATESPLSRVAPARFGDASASAVSNSPQPLFFSSFSSLPRGSFIDSHLN
jgi:hypothetical protein